tara:strand:- start:1063 stop:1311 length:249 start_codon:yes stop_codon:yes gene_type:complete
MGLEQVIQVIQYVVVQVNVGTKHIGRGKRGIEIDVKEFMALRNLVHFYCPNPFIQIKNQDETKSHIKIKEDIGDDTKRMKMN